MTPDYSAALAAAAIFDTSAAGKLILAGPDAPMFLGNLSTNDIKNLPLGGGCEAYFCDARAKVQFAAWIDHVLLMNEHALWVETTAGRNDALAKYLDRYLISERVEISDRTTDFLQFHLAGPGAKAALDRALGETLPELPEFAHLQRDLGQIRRRDLLGVPGYDIVCIAKPNLDAVDGTPETFETLRIEAGTPLFGPDIDESRFVMEVGRATRAVSYSKGCYLGQEPIVMARDRAGHVNRAFLGLKALDGAPPAPGTKLFRDGQEVGVVTSSCHSPRLGIPVALGYLRWKHQDPGLKLETESRQVFEVVGPSPLVPA